MRPAVALIGSLLIDPEAVHDVRFLVDVEDFETPQGREAYSAILAVDDRGDPVDFVTVCDELERRGTLWKMVKPIEHLVGAINQTPTSLHAVSYARLVSEAADRRRIPAANGLPAGALTW